MLKRHEVGYMLHNATEKKLRPKRCRGVRVEAYGGYVDLRVNGFFSKTRAAEMSSLDDKEFIQPPTMIDAGSGVDVMGKKDEAELYNLLWHCEL